MVVTVTDHGIGISAEDQSRLFKNFVQIRPSAFQEGQGSGLGLAFCRELVCLHGGGISVTSVEGEYSSFSFTIPLRWFDSPDGSTAVVDVQDSENVDATSTELLRKIKVLVVDDSVSYRKMLSLLLKRKDIDHDLAENGRIAVDMVLSNPSLYDVVLMDNIMPEMDGVQATRLLRERNFKNIIVGATGNVLDEDVVEFLDAGADAVFFKPISFAMVNSLISFLRTNGGSRREGHVLKHSEIEVSWHLKGMAHAD